MAAAAVLNSARDSPWLDLTSISQTRLNNRARHLTSDAMLSNVARSVVRPAAPMGAWLGAPTPHCALVVMLVHARQRACACLQAGGAVVRGAMAVAGGRREGGGGERDSHVGVWHLPCHPPARAGPHPTPNMSALHAKQCVTRSVHTGLVWRGVVVLRRGQARPHPHPPCSPWCGVCPSVGVGSGVLLFPVGPMSPLPLQCLQCGARAVEAVRALGECLCQRGGALVACTRVVWTDVHAPLAHDRHAARPCTVLTQFTLYFCTACGARV